MAKIDLTAVSEFDFASDAYWALFLRSRCSPFQHPDWLTPFYRILAPAYNARPLIVVGRHVGSGALKLVVPLIRRRIGGTVAIESAFLGVSDYAVPLIDTTIEIEDGGLARDFLAALGAFDRLEITPVRRDDLEAWRPLLPGRPIALGFGAHHLRMASPPTVAPALARKMRRLAELGPLRLDLAVPESVRQVMSAAQRFRRGRFPNDPMQHDASFAFYVEVAMRGARSGLARTYMLSCGDRLVAVLFGVIHRRRFHYLVLGCDYASHRRFSPGMIMFAKTMKHWFDDGGDVYDFTIGDEPFKTALGCERTPMYGLPRTGTIRRRAPAMAVGIDA
ncbi:MAG: GNAT family N-acetyltransferase [Dongiaceae bacterium]